MPNQEDFVTLQPAYLWDCPECGREVFERGCIPEMSAEEMAELREEFGIEVADQGDFVTMPDEVTCPHCGASFSTEHYGQTRPTN